MFFDEKMDGTLHIDLGLSFPETSSKVMSTIYWDILKNMKSEESNVILIDELFFFDRCKNISKYSISI